MSCKNSTTGKYPRGRKVSPPHVVTARHQAAFVRHGWRVGRLRDATPAAFDCRTAFNNVLPVDDQGQCGDCYGVSAADGCSMALIKAGVLPLDPSRGRLSSQYGLDNSQAFQGGCNGGDEAEVIDFIKTTGFPLTSDYGPYQGGPGTLKPLTGMQIYKIADWGYCTPGQEQGVASTQDMKNAMVQYGPLSVAFDASGCDSYTWPNVMDGQGSSVDHAVLCIGWDDSKGAFLGMNQWGAGWGGPNGTFWIKYGAFSWGTEAIWLSAGAVPPPPPPPPPPGPTANVLTLVTPLAKGTYPIDAQGCAVLLVDDMPAGTYPVPYTPGPSPPPPPPGPGPVPPAKQELADVAAFLSALAQQQK